MLAGAMSSSSVLDQNSGPTNAVDLLLSSAFVSNDEENPWYQIEFDGPTSVTMVEIIGREACCPERFHSVTVSVGDNPMNDKELSTNPVCNHFTGPATVMAQTVQFNCENGPTGGPLEGKYMAVQIEETEVLGFSEIVVYGHPLSG